MMNDQGDLNREAHKRVGSILLWLGGLVSILVVADRSGFASSFFPAFWYRSRPMHLLICVGFFVAGVLIYRRPDHAEEDSASHELAGSRSNPRFESVRFYTRTNCPLCDEAMEVLEEYGDTMPEIEFVDIAGNADLEQQYGNWIPVVEIDGRVRFRGRVDRVLLQRLIDAKRRGETDPDDREVSA